MVAIAVVRTKEPLPDEKAMGGASAFLFRALTGMTSDDTRAWRKFWKKLQQAGAGEMVRFEVYFERLGWYHRKHFAMLVAVFEAQDCFTNFDPVFRSWAKIGAGHVEWIPGADGELVPLPRSIAYEELDQAEFERVHEETVNFFLTPRAYTTLWPHLAENEAADMMQAIIEPFLGSGWQG